MYCVNCGVKLADTEKICPLCNTVAYHPEIKQQSARPLYPLNKKPRISGSSKALCGALVIMFLIPVFVCFFADLQTNGTLDWFGLAAGALLLSYIILALPIWFRNPNPVVFVPCDFAAVAVYLWYIDFALGGGWFWPFALPIVAGLCVITCTVVTLTHYLRKGRLYIFGGAFIALGLFMILIEILINIAFGIRFVGWSVYPMVVLALLGGVLIFLAINRSAREMMERKLFF